MLERADIDILFERVRALKARASFVFVSHRLDEVLEMSDRVYVMKDGARGGRAAGAPRPTCRRCTASWSAAGCRRSTTASRCRSRSAPRSCCRREGLALEGAYRDVSFELHAGEILGHRRRHRLRPRGADPHARRLRPAYEPARLTIGGKEVRFASPAEAVDRGIGYVPRERRTEGLVLFLPVAANITLASLGQLRRYGLIARPRERRRGRGLGRSG